MHWFYVPSLCLYFMLVDIYLCIIFVLAPVITQQSSCFMYETHTILTFIVSAKGLQLLL